MLNAAAADQDFATEMNAVGAALESIALDLGVEVSNEALSMESIVETIKNAIRKVFELIDRAFKSIVRFFKTIFRHLTGQAQIEKRLAELKAEYDADQKRFNATIHIVPRTKIEYDISIATRANFKRAVYSSNSIMDEMVRDADERMTGINKAVNALRDYSNAMMDSGQSSRAAHDSIMLRGYGTNIPNAVDGTKVTFEYGEELVEGVPLPRSYKIGNGKPVEELEYAKSTFEIRVTSYSDLVAEAKPMIQLFDKASKQCLRLEERMEGIDLSKLVADLRRGDKAFFRGDAQDAPDQYSVSKMTMARVYLRYLAATTTVVLRAQTAALLHQWRCVIALDAMLARSVPNP